MSTTSTVRVTFSNYSLKKDKLILFKAAITSAVNNLEPRSSSTTPLSKKRSRKNDLDRRDDLDTIASRIAAKYNEICTRFQGPGTEWEAWHCFVGNDLVYAVRPRNYVMCEVTGGPVLKERKLSLFAFRSANSSTQENLRQQSIPANNVLHDVDPDPDHMDRTQIMKVRTDMDATTYNAFADACRIAMAKKHAQGRAASATSEDVATLVNSSFADAAMYIRSRLEMMEVLGGEWHVVAAKANKGELKGGRACSANVDSDAQKVTIVTGGGVRIFAFQHADNAPSEDTCLAKCTDVLTSKKRTVTMLIMFALMFVYFMLGKMEALNCLEGGSRTSHVDGVGGGSGGKFNGDFVLPCNADEVKWAQNIDAGRSGVLVAALGFFVVGAVLKTVKASKGRSQKRFLKSQ